MVLLMRFFSKAVCVKYMKQMSKSHIIRSRNLHRLILFPVTLVACVLAMTFQLTGWAWALNVTDDTGHLIELDKPAQRIITLYGGYNEVIAALGIEDRLIARTKADRVPESIVKKPVIGTHMRPNVEMVMALKPDLIIQNAGRREAMTPVEQLKKHGLNVAVFSPETFEELFSVVLRIGVITGTQPQAESLVNKMKDRLRVVQEKNSGAIQRPRVFFEARYPNLLAAGQASIVNDILKFAGAENCVNANKKFVRVNEESLLSWNPDYYLIQVGPMNRNPIKLKDRPHYQSLRAFSENRFQEVDEQIFSRPGPRSVDAVEQLSRIIHPQLWPLN